MDEWLNHQSIGRANFVPKMVDKWTDEDIDSGFFLAITQFVIYTT